MSVGQATGRYYRVGRGAITLHEEAALVACRHHLCSVARVTPLGNLLVTIPGMEVSDC
jgi:hypothetical protein